VFYCRYLCSAEVIGMHGNRPQNPSASCGPVSTDSHQQVREHSIYLFIIQLIIQLLMWLMFSSVVNDVSSFWSNSVY